MTTQFAIPAASPVQPEMKEFLAGYERVAAEVRAVPGADHAVDTRRYRHP